MSFHSAIKRGLWFCSLVWMSCYGGVPLEYHVSPTLGADDNPGAQGAPFRTLERALRQHRILLASGAYPEGGVRIVLAPGRYELSEGLVLDEDDCVPPGRHLILDGGGRAVVSGGVLLRQSSFRTVTDPEILSRLQPVARGRVSELDLHSWPGHGWTPMAEVERQRAGWGLLVLNGESLPVSRWPNVGWGAVGKVLGRGVFEVGSEVPVERWSGTGELYLHGFWRYDWHDEVIRTAGVQGRHVALCGDGGTYGLAGKAQGIRRFAVLNALEEVDREGEWCLDRGRGRLYAWLPICPGESVLVYARLTKPLLRARGCQGLVLRGLDFDCSRGDGVVLEGDGNLVQGCRFRHLGGTALVIRGRNNRVKSCDLSDIGGSGVRLEGGDRPQLLPGYNAISNCHIWQVGRFCRAYHGGIHLRGVENIIRSNLIRDVPHSAIFYGGNNHLIEGNEMFGTCLETGDGGALYSSRDWGSQGNRIVHNYIHHVGGLRGGSKGVYLDDCDSGDIILGNLFLGLSGAVYLGGGRDNQVRNNVFVACHPAVHLDDRGVRRIVWNQGLSSGWDLEAKLKALNYQASPWREAYPHLARIMADRPSEPLHNSIERNVIAGGSGFSMKGTLREKVTTQFNWYSDRMEEFGFCDLAAGNLAFEDMSLVWGRVPGFREIPQQRIGLRHDEYRRDLPDTKALVRDSLRQRENLNRMVEARQAESILPQAPMMEESGEESRKQPPASIQVIELGWSDGAVTTDGLLDEKEWKGAGRCQLRHVGKAPAWNGRLMALATPKGLALGVVCEGTDAGALMGKAIEVRLRPRRAGEDVILRGVWGKQLTVSGARQAAAAQDDGLRSGWQSGRPETGALRDRFQLECLIPWRLLGGQPATGLGIPLRCRIAAGSGTLALGEAGEGRCYLVMP